ncbi:N-acetylneuraminate synthase [Planktomarina sp.]|nr:N-acetylneuraminate synthase [Planktomarina sp.]
MSVLVIAEAGVNHNGDLEMAKALIDVASDAGADIVKFQSFKADKLLIRNAPKAEYQKKNDGDNEDHYAMIKRLELSEEMHRNLLDHCLEKNITFLSTGFDIDSNNFLVDLGGETLKVPSGEITNLPYLRHVGSLNKDLIISTGMSDLSDIERALTIVVSAGTPKENITILHCSTEYPTAMEDTNLLAMGNIGRAFGVKVGYSDHTKGIEVPIAAVALGATIIEKHFTLDRNLAGPDHDASVEPKQLKEMIAAIRNIEVALGDGIKRPSARELKNKPIVRKSIVAASNIKAGETFTENNISVKRPGIGICPMDWDKVIGREAIRDFSVDELIQL